LRRIRRGARGLRRRDLLAERSHRLRGGFALQEFAT